MGVTFWRSRQGELIWLLIVFWEQSFGLVFFFFFRKRTAASRTSASLHLFGVIFCQAFEMEDELRQLRAQVEQLQLENQRLSVPRPSGDVGVGQASGSDPVSSRREQAVYLPRERKCPKFSGSLVVGALSVEEWIEEAQSCIRLRYMSELDKALFLLDHLEGEARNEIKYRPQRVRENSEQICDVLKEVYGCSKSYVYWQQKFFDRKQRDGESLYEFSHALLALMERVEQCKSGAISNTEIVIRDQFCENVRDPMLRRELKRLVRSRETMSLLEVRREAIQWVEEGQTSREKQVRPSPHTCEVQVTPNCEVPCVQPSSELMELKNMVLKQQAQLDLLVKHLAPATGKPPVKNNRFKRASDGRPICIRCNLPGHIARYCETVLGAQIIGGISIGEPTRQSEN